MPETKSNILLLVVKHERNEAVWKETAARKAGIYVPFVVELQNQSAWYTADEWEFLPGNTEQIKAVMAVKDIIKTEVAKLIPKEQITDIIYRLIDRACAPKGPHLPTVLVLVKPNSCGKWHDIESQVKDAVNQAVRGEKDTEIYLEFGTGKKPRTSAEEVLRMITSGPVHAHRRGAYEVVWHSFA